MVNKLKYETYEKLVRLFNFDPSDYGLWNEMLRFYDSDAIDKSVQILILKKSKAPTVADVAALAEAERLRREAQLQELQEICKRQEEEEKQKLIS